MATLLQQSAANQHQHQHLLYTNSVVPTSQNSHHFCKDCGVMFESSTSLEVHLSYHKENLLTRWANQDVLDKSSSSSSGSGSSSTSSSGSHYTNPSSPSPKRDSSLSRSDNSSVESNSSQSHYFHPVESHSHNYLPSLYNNNTGDPMHPSPSPYNRSTPTNFLLQQQQPPVDQPMYEHSPFQPGYPHPHPHHPHHHHHHHHPIFSPNHELPHPPLPIPGSRESAEILDLDSHKVHIYQHQQQQQQQGFFHRPYLLPPLPPQPQGQSSGWQGSNTNGEQGQGQGQGGSFPSNRFSPVTAGGYPQVEPTPPHAFFPPGPGSGNPTVPAPNGSGGIHQQSFEIVRIENPAYGSHEGPQSVGGSFPSPVPVSFGHPSPYSTPQIPIKNDNASPPGAPSSKKSQRSPNNGNAKASPTSGIQQKTKGWKGGECKRPKTYNCPACNKWFTSSGHLKRHYGTTLHKNSMKQLGEGAEELLKQTPKKKGKAANPNNEMKPKAQKTIKPRNSSGPDNNNDHDDDLGLGMGESGNIIKKEQMGGNNDQYILPDEMNEHRGGHLVNGDIKPYVPLPPQPTNNFNYYIGGAPPSQSHHILIPPPPTSQQSPVVPSYNNIPTPNSNNGYFVLDFAPVVSHHGHSLQYSNGFRQELINNNNNDRESASGPLPPFSSVALSHYGASSSAPEGMEQDPSPFHNHRATPPSYHQMTPLSTSDGPQAMGHADTSYESPMDTTANTTLTNGGSPFDIQSGNGSSSSNDGSLDGMTSPCSEDGGVVDLPATGSSRKLPKSEVHECPLCSKTFNRSCYFKQHFKQQHSNNSELGGALHKCTTCGKRFPVADALADHVVKHGNNKPYKCDQCPKQFNHKTDLNRHRLLHTGDRPFVCDQCGKGFIRKDHMSKHCETHSKSSARNSKNHSSASSSSSSSAANSPNN